MRSKIIVCVIIWPLSLLPIILLHVQYAAVEIREGGKETIVQLFGKVFESKLFRFFVDCLLSWACSIISSSIRND